MQFLLLKFEFGSKGISTYQFWAKRDKINMLGELKLFWVNRDWAE